MTGSVIERLTQLYEADQASGKLARTPDDIPISYEAITDEWLDAIFCHGTPGAKVTGHSLGPTDNGTSSRRMIFIDYNAEGRAAGLPASTFGKSSQSLVQRISYVLNSSLWAETHFYNALRPLVELECPVSYHARSDAETANSIVLLEDIAARVEFCDENTTISRANAEEMMATLATLHANFYQPEKLAVASRHFGTWSDRWRGLVAGNGMDEYCNKGFQRAEDVIPARLFARIDEVMPKTSLAVELTSPLPHTFTHADTHLSNWYRTHDGKMGITDWQGSDLDYWARDVSYALCCALSVEDRRAWMDDLVALYAEEMRVRGVPREIVDGGWDHVRRHSLTALAYWTVTYSPSPGMPPDMQPPVRTREYIRRIATAVDDLDALDAF